MSKKKEKELMMTTYTKFMEKNKDKIRKIAEANAKKNQDGLTVIDKDDPWRKETEWDKLYWDLEEKK